MKKIVLIPIDERPCTYAYPNMLASMAKDINFVEIPREFMGDCKIPGNMEKMHEFLIKECVDADYAIIAIDSILYGGIVPSRLHYDSEETLLERLNVLRKIKEINPKIKLYAYHLIMRCPSGSGDSEEPNYYALCGREIQLLGAYKHKEQVNALTDFEKEDYENIKKFIADNNYQQYVPYPFGRKTRNFIRYIHTSQCYNTTQRPISNKQYKFYQE